MQQRFLHALTGGDEGALFLRAFPLCLNQGIASALSLMSLPCGIRLLPFQIPALGQTLLLTQPDTQFIQLLAAFLLLPPPRFQLLLIAHAAEGKQHKLLLTHRIPPFAVSDIVILQSFQLRFLRAHPLQIAFKFLVGIEHLAQYIQFQITGQQDVFVNEIAHMIYGAKGKGTRKCRQKARGKLPQSVHETLLPLLLARFKDTAGVCISPPKRLARIECPVCTPKFDLCKGAPIQQEKLLLQLIVTKDIDDIARKE